MKHKRVVVGLSGGVDSAVSAFLLKKAGYDVVGVHLVCWPPVSERIKSQELRIKNGCKADEDRKSALKTALELEIPFKVLDYSEEYNQKVVDYFYHEYEIGRTPNPDILCNSEIKFGLFLQWALENGFDYIATGHYAKIEFCHCEEKSDEAIYMDRHVGVPSRDDEDVKLFIPSDKHKDQTYFLWKLRQKELQHVLFPLGDLLKSEVRKIAQDNKLSVAQRPDSQGICFVGEVNVRDFLKKRLKEKPGNVLDSNGKIIGKHKGMWFYTIGQRGGWEVMPKIQKTLGDLEPMYVISKDVKKNELVVGTKKEGERNSFCVTNFTLIDESAITMVRIRHCGELVNASVNKLDKKLFVETEKGMFGIAPGQSAVFYSDEGQCLGGGMIE